MKKLAKMAVGLTAVAMAATAFAGGPEMAAPTISGFNIGLGFGYKTFSWTMRQVYLSPGTFGFYDVNITKFGPLGEVGYTFQLNNWAFLGLRFYYQYDNARMTNQLVRLGFAQAYVNAQSHLAAMFLAGAMLNSSNAVYIELGYSALWLKKHMELDIATVGAFVSTTNRTTLSGGIAGIGWRHYFMNNVYLDLSYDFALYAKDTQDTFLPATTAANSGPHNLFPVEKMEINGVTATLNYLFNV